MSVWDRLRLATIQTNARPTRMFSAAEASGKTVRMGKVTILVILMILTITQYVLNQ